VTKQKQATVTDTHDDHCPGIPAVMDTRESSREMRDRIKLIITASSEQYVGLINKLRYSATFVLKETFIWTSVVGCLYEHFVVRRKIMPCPHNYFLECKVVFVGRYSLRYFVTKERRKLPTFSSRCEFSVNVYAIKLENVENRPQTLSENVLEINFMACLIC
jgi:hypothetical protein